MKTRIVILGAGFAGIYTFQSLLKIFKNDPNIELVIVNKRNYFLFTPMLHEVATGNISPENIIDPIRSIIGNSKKGECQRTFLQADVLSISIKDHLVKTTAGDIVFNYLLIALGAETNFFGIPGAQEYAYELKTLEDALKIKNRIIENLEKATRVTDQATLEKLLHFVIIGGGPTGVELAGEMADFLWKTFRVHYPSEVISKIKLTIVERGAELLPQLSPLLRKRAQKSLERKGIAILFNKAVNEITSDCIKMTDNTCLYADTIIWSAGVAPRVLSFDTDIEKTKDNRIMVNSSLQITNHPEIFVLGDLASFTDSKSGKPLPPLAQVATKQALYVANAVARLVNGKPLKPYYYRHAGTLVSLGEWRAAGDIFGLHIFGRLTWILWRGVYLWKLMSFNKRVQVFLDWCIDCFLPRDISDYYEDSSLKKKK